jgi:hypothetical protein
MIMLLYKNQENCKNEDFPYDTSCFQKAMILDGKTIGKSVLNTVKQGIA